MINVTLTGAEKFGKAPPLIKAAARRAALVGAQTYTEAVHNWIDQGHAFFPRTGNLQQGIGWRPEAQGGVVYSQGEVGKYLELGTKGPYLIAPKRRKALKWGSRSQGGYRFSRGVMHPGIKAGKFSFFFTDMDRREALVIEAARDQMADDLSEVLD